MLKFIMISFLFSGYVSFKVAKSYFMTISPYLVMPTLFVLIQLFVILRLFERAFPAITLPNVLSTISYIIMAFAIIFFVYFLIFDILSIFKVDKILPLNKKYIILALTIITFIYGYVHQLSPIITTYDIVTEKVLNKPLKIVFISDLHIDSATTDRYLKKEVDRINALSADMVLIGGDLVDINIDHLTASKKLILRSLSAPVYAVIGNHEYYSGEMPNIIKNIEDADIKVLQDEAIKIDNLSLTLIGRDTRSYRVTTSALIDNREPLYKLMQNIDNSSLIILIDHIPENDAIEPMKRAGIDINLSGHTHNGQFFPVNFIVRYMYDNAYGLKKFDNLTHIVSSGMGLWGPPIRIGTSSEIVILNIKN